MAYYISLKTLIMAFRHAKAIFVVICTIQLSFRVYSNDMDERLSGM